MADSALILPVPRLIRRSSHGMGRRGFTVLELLVVIGIIAILATMIGFAMSGVMNRSKATATRVTLTNARGLIGEFETVAKGLTRQPARIFVGGNAVTPAAGTTIDIWHDADPNTAGNQPLQAPQNVSKDYAKADPQKNRYESDAVLNTQLVMGLLQSVPNNKRAIGQMPSNQLMTDVLPASKLTLNAAGTPDPVLVVDGWGNPIIFVPGSGLWDVIVGDAPARLRVPSAAGALDGPIKSKDGRPFWASAGPDGDFQKGDDNMYSFEE